MNTRPGIRQIEEAALRMAGHVQHTPLVLSRRLSDIHGRQIYLKLESLQVTGSYKVRGAFNNISQRRISGASGVVTASAGNHAQGVAYTASVLGIAASSTVFVPAGTPQVKRDGTLRFGVKVVEEGADFDACKEIALENARATSRPFIDPFDDWATIAGQGTVGLEIASDLPDVDAIVVPVGGGGLAAGIGIVSEARLPKTKVYGVQAVGADAMRQSLRDGELTQLSRTPVTLADGIRVARPGERCFEVLRDLRTKIVAVTERDIMKAVADHVIETKTVVEGAAATPLAALKTALSTESPEGAKVVLVVTGGNIDGHRLKGVIHQAYAPRRIFKTIRVTLMNRVGLLQQLLRPIAEYEANVLDISTRVVLTDEMREIMVVDLYLELSRENQEPDFGPLIKQLRTSGFEVRELD